MSGMPPSILRFLPGNRLEPPRASNTARRTGSDAIIAVRGQQTATGTGKIHLATNRRGPSGFSR